MPLTDALYATMMASANDGANLLAEYFGGGSIEGGVAAMNAQAKELGLEIEIFQSNHEGARIDEVHRAYFEKADGIIINAGGYTHTSVALLAALAIPGAAYYAIWAMAAVIFALAVYYTVKQL